MQVSEAVGTQMHLDYEPQDVAVLQEEHFLLNRKKKSDYPPIGKKLYCFRAPSIFLRLSGTSEKEVKTKVSGGLHLFGH